MAAPMQDPGAVFGPKRLRHVVLALALLLTLLSFLQACHRAGQGRSALIKWRPAVERLLAGEQVYGVDATSGREGFPTLPMTALVLAPFLKLGDVAGAISWAGVKLALAWWSVLAALKLAAGRARDFPAWGTLAVVLLCARLIASDIAHGNVNLLIAAVLVAGLLDWSAGRELRAGVWIGLAAVLKATPLLFALYFLRKRSVRGLAGVLLGIGLFACILPASILGWERNLDLARTWWQQMAQPYIEGTRLGLTQTEHINQSLLGVLARLFSDAVAIPARPPSAPADVRLTLFALPEQALYVLHRGLSAAVLLAALLAARAPRRPAPSSRASLGEWSMMVLVMLLVSERSWKQHYVVFFLPLVFLAWYAFPVAVQGALDPPALRARKVARAGLAASAVLHGLSGSAILGPVGSDYAEALGVHVWGALMLLLCCALIVSPRRTLGCHSDP